MKSLCAPISALVALLAWPAHGWTESDPAPAGDPAATPTAQRGISSDATLDRAWLSPTAFTQPKRSLALTLVPTLDSLVLFSSYGIIDRVHITSLMVAELDGGGSMVGSLSGKGQVYTSNRVRVAVLGGFTALKQGRDYELDYAFHGGLAYSLCIDAGCHSLLSNSVGMVVELDDGDLSLAYAGSLIVRVIGPIKLVVEYQKVSTDAFDELDSYLLAGARGAWRSWGVDLGVVIPFEPETSEHPLPPLPALSLSYRAAL